MDLSAEACAEIATRVKLTSPEWETNQMLCEILKADPRKTKDALEVLKTRLGHPDPRIQVLCLTVLETLCANCGDEVFQQIVKLKILDNMVKIVQKKPDSSVKEKILVLIDTWQEALGGSSGSFPQYYKAYNKLKLDGEDFRRYNNTVASTSLSSAASGLSCFGSTTTSTGSGSDPLSPTPDFWNWTGGAVIIMRLKEHILITCNRALRKKNLIEVGGKNEFGPPSVEEHDFLYELDQTTVCVFFGFLELAEEWKCHLFDKIEEEKKVYRENKRNKPGERTFSVEDYVGFLDQFRKEKFEHSKCPKERVEVILASWNPNKECVQKASIYHSTNAATTYVEENCFQAGIAFGLPIRALTRFPDNRFPDDMQIQDAVNLAEKAMCQVSRNAPTFGVDVWYFGPLYNKSKKYRAKEQEKEDNITRMKKTKDDLMRLYPMC